MITVLATVFVLGVLIFIHEMGHFLSAKLFRIRVERFSMGYPPRLFGKTIGETDYCVSAIPVGGYVKIAGMVDESMDQKQLDKKPEPWEFRSKPWIQKFLVIFSGSVMNLILAFLIYTGGILIQGVDEIKDPQIVGKVIPDMPASRAGIRSGDRILSVNGEKITAWEQMTEIIHSSPGKTVNLVLSRKDSLFDRNVVPVKEKVFQKGDLVEIGLIGIQPTTETRPATFVEAISGSATTMYYFTKMVFVSLGKLFTGKESVKSFAGIIFIAKTAGESARSGASVLFGFMAILSLNLGILNLMPIPALDGGHILLLAVEGLIRREIPVKTKMVIQQVGMALLVGLMLLATYNDILRIIHK